MGFRLHTGGRVGLSVTLLGFGDVGFYFSGFRVLGSEVRL